MISTTRYGCAAARNKGTCDNRKTIYRRDVETRILTGLRQKLWTQDMVREFIKEFHVAMRDADTKAARARKAHQKHLEEVAREITNMLDAIAKGMFHESMNARMDALEAERKDLEARIAALAYGAAFPTAATQARRSIKQLRGINAERPHSTHGTLTRDEVHGNQI